MRAAMVVPVHGGADQKIEESMSIPQSLSAEQELSAELLQLSAPTPATMMVIPPRLEAKSPAQFITHMDIESRAQRQQAELEELRNKKLARNLKKELDEVVSREGAQIPLGAEEMHDFFLKQKDFDKRWRQEQQDSKYYLHSYRNPREGGSPKTERRRAATAGMAMPSEIDQFYLQQKEREAEWKRKQQASKDYLHGYRNTQVTSGAKASSKVGPQLVTPQQEEQDLMMGYACDVVRGDVDAKDEFELSRSVSDAVGAYENRPIGEVSMDVVPHTREGYAVVSSAVPVTPVVDERLGTIERTNGGASDEHTTMLPTDGADKDAIEVTAGETFVQISTGDSSVQVSTDGQSEGRVMAGKSENESDGLVVYLSVEKSEKHGKGSDQVNAVEPFGVATNSLELQASDSISTKESTPATDIPEKTKVSSLMSDWTTDDVLNGRHLAATVEQDLDGAGGPDETDVDCEIIDATLEDETQPKQDQPAASENEVRLTGNTDEGDAVRELDVRSEDGSSSNDQNAEGRHSAKDKPQSLVQDVDSKQTIEVGSQAELHIKTNALLGTELVTQGPIVSVGSVDEVALAAVGTDEGGGKGNNSEREPLHNAFLDDPVDALDIDADESPAEEWADRAEFAGSAGSDGTGRDVIPNLSTPEPEISFDASKDVNEVASPGLPSPESGPLALVENDTLHGLPDGEPLQPDASVPLVSDRESVGEELPNLEPAASEHKDGVVELSAEAELSRAVGRIAGASHTLDDVVGPVEADDEDAEEVEVTVTEGGHPTITKDAKIEVENLDSGRTGNGPNVFADAGAVDAVGSVVPSQANQNDEGPLENGRKAAEVSTVLRSAGSSKIPRVAPHRGDRKSPSRRRSEGMTQSNAIKQQQQRQRSKTPKQRVPRKSTLTEPTAASLGRRYNRVERSKTPKHRREKQSSERSLFRTPKKSVPLYKRTKAIGSHIEAQCKYEKWTPELHKSRNGCERCVFLLSPSETEYYKRHGHHYRINMCRGGCNRDCKIFPRKEDEEPARLCVKCFYDTHRLGKL